MLNVAEEVTVEDTRYIFVKYKTTKGLETLHKLGQLIGKPVAQLMVAGMNQSNAEVTPELVGNSLQHVISAMAPTEFAKFAAELMEGTEIITPERKRPLNFEVDFQGRLGHLTMRVIPKMVSWQFENFLDALASVTPELGLILKSRAAAAEATPTQGKVIKAL